VFGTEARFSPDGALGYCDPAVLKSNPNAQLGRDGPGPAYNPDYRRSRPSSAPSYSWARAQTPRSGGVTSSSGSRECSVAGAGSGLHSESRPMSARSARSSSCHSDYEAGGRSSIGRAQVDSRRRTGRSASFGTSPRFPEARQASNTSSEQQYIAESAFGTRSRSSSRARKTEPPTFARATREAAGRQVVMKGTDGVASKPPRMPHPVLPPRQEILRFSSPQTPR